MPAIGCGPRFGDRYDATGYRAPSLLRTAALIADLGPLYRYDASIPTFDGAFPVPNNGCASARPWRIGSLWEIPLTPPRDGNLRFLGYQPGGDRCIMARYGCDDCPVGRHRVAADALRERLLRQSGDA